MLCVLIDLSLLLQWVQVTRSVEQLQIVLEMLKRKSYRTLNKCRSSNATDLEERLLYKIASARPEKRQNFNLGHYVKTSYSHCPLLSISIGPFSINNPNRDEPPGPPCNQRTTGAVAGSTCFNISMNNKVITRLPMVYVPLLCLRLLYISRYHILVHVWCRTTIAKYSAYK